MFAKVREHVGWDRYMGPGGEGGRVARRVLVGEI